jgi:FKBP-type peptidyl-prolyl cis-trans isomerase FkpA
MLRTVRLLRFNHKSARDNAMQTIITAILITLIAAPAIAGETAKPAERNTLYAVGLTVAHQLSVFNLTPAELEIVKQGFTDGVSGKTPEVELRDYHEKIQELARDRRKAEGDRLAAANQDFLAHAAEEKGAVNTPSGLIFFPLQEGNGASPGPDDKVVVKYRGTLADGKEVDSSDKGGKPAEFRLTGVIRCWSEGLQMMKAGGKAKLVCPSRLAYGERGKGYDILPGAPLVFEIELVDVKKQ